MQVGAALVDTHGVAVVGAGVVRQIRIVRLPVAVRETTDAVLGDNILLLDAVGGFDEHQTSRLIPHTFTDFVVQVCRHTLTYFLLQLGHYLIQACQFIWCQRLSHLIINIIVPPTCWIVDHAIRIILNHYSEIIRQLILGARCYRIISTS